MVYDSGKKLRKKEINLLKNATDIRQVQYLGVRLVDEQCEYEPEEITEYAIEKGYASRLGYLAETALEAARKLEAEKNMNLTRKLDRLEKLINLLYPHRSKHYEFLLHFSNNDDFDRVLKKLDKDRSTYKSNKKWKVYSAIHPPDIEEYIELYLIDLRQGNYVRLGLETIRT